MISDETLADFRARIGALVGQWSASQLSDLLRHGRKNPGPWDDSEEPDEMALPAEVDAWLIVDLRAAMVPLLDALAEARQMAQAWEHAACARQAERDEARAENYKLAAECEMRAKAYLEIAMMYDDAKTAASDMHRRAQRLEGADEHLATVRAGYEKEQNQVRRHARWISGERKLELRAFTMRMRAAGVPDHWGIHEHAILPPGEMLTRLIAQRDEARAELEKMATLFSEEIYKTRAELAMMTKERDKYKYEEP